MTWTLSAEKRRLFLGFFTPVDASPSLLPPSKDGGNSEALFCASVAALQDVRALNDASGFISLVGIQGGSVLAQNDHHRLGGGRWFIARRPTIPPGYPSSATDQPSGRLASLNPGRWAIAFSTRRSHKVEIVHNGPATRAQVEPFSRILTPQRPLTPRIHLAARPRRHGSAAMTRRTIARRDRVLNRVCPLRHLSHVLTLLACERFSGAWQTSSDVAPLHVLCGRKKIFLRGVTFRARFRITK